MSVEPTTPVSGSVAETVAVPTESAVANPFVSVVMKSAIAALEDAHVALAVTSTVELSESVAVAVNCCVAFSGTEGASGVTAMDTITGDDPPHAEKKYTDAKNARKTRTNDLEVFFIIFPP